MTTQSEHQTPTLAPYSSVQYLPPLDPVAIEKALMAGDLAKLDSQTRVKFYQALCQSTGLNPLARAFITMKGQDGAVHWYVSKEGAEMLRKLHHVSVRPISRAMDEDGLYTVTVHAWLPDGREDESQGIVFVGDLKGQALGNAKMRCETKAKRRATLALCGLGLGLAEDHTGQVVPFDPQTGDLHLPPEPSAEAGALLTVVGAWLRQRPKGSREAIAHAVWGCTLPEMPHLGYEELRAGWARLDEGRAPLQWDSVTLEEDLAQWTQAHAYQSIQDVFDRSEGRPEEGH